MLFNRNECLLKYGSDYFINQKVQNKVLFRVEKGIFSDVNHVPDLAILSFKYPNAVITLNTAFYLYDLNDEAPDVYTMATKRSAAPINDARIKQYFMPSEILGLGISSIEYKGYKLQIYNRERMLIELVRYKDKFSFDYYKECIGNYRRILPQLDLGKIRDYAEAVPKSEKVIKTLRMEVF